MRLLGVLVVILALIAPLAGSLPAPDPVALAGTVLSHVPHAPIFIDSDDVFCGDAARSGVVNCMSADGSAARPFEIRGWSVEASATKGLPAITITHTTKHVAVLANALLTANADAIPTVVLTDVSNVSLSNNTIRAGRAEALLVDGARPDGTFLASNFLLAGLVDGPRVVVAKLAHVEGGSFSSNTFRASDSVDAVDALLEISDSHATRFQGTFFASSNGTAARIVDSDQVSFIGTFVNHVRTGFDVASSPGMSVVGLNATQVLVGIVARDSGTLALQNVQVFDDYPCEPACTQSVGVSSTRTSLSFLNGTVSGFDTGILAASAPGEPEWAVRAACLTLNGNGIGLDVNDTDDSTLYFSRIENNGIGVRNTGPSTFHAEFNWWGQPGGPVPGETVGKVNASWPLATPPSCAP